MTANRRRFLIVCTLGVAASTWSNGPLRCQQPNAPWNAQTPLYDQEPPAESQQYDFLIGDWDIVAKRYNVFNGSVLSEVSVHQHTEYRNDGRMIVSEWTATSPTTGKKVAHGITLTTYSNATKKWQNVYLGSMQPGPVTGFATERVGDEIHGGGPTFRIRFFDITPNSYEWEQRVQIRNGDTWLLERTQSATRRQAE